MSSNIDSFLKLKPKKQRVETINIKLQGEDLEFKIHDIEPAELAEIQMVNTVAIPSSVEGGPTVEGANPINLSLDVCVASIIEPNLKSIELQDHFNVTTPKDLLYEMFKGDTEALGELFTKIVDISSSGSDQEEEDEDSKPDKETKKK